MRKKLIWVIILTLSINDNVCGNKANKTNSIKNIQSSIKEKLIQIRLKRSLDDDVTKLPASYKDSTKYGHIVEGRGHIKNMDPKDDKEVPFWGSRGRRVSAEELVPNADLPTYNQMKLFEKISILQRLYINYENKLRKYEDSYPFLGNRERRTSDESDESDINLFWASRGRRQDEEPFWGTRGRREYDERVRESKRDDDEPFWGNRGRRQEQDPFWGNRGRRNQNHGINKIKSIYMDNMRGEPYEGGENKLQIKMKDSVLETINHVRQKLQTFDRNRRDVSQPSLLWSNKGRSNKLKPFFNGNIRNIINYDFITTQNKATNPKPPKILEPNTVIDNKMYAEEPRYFLVERTSRSSAEDVPFFISRGKKYSDFDLDNGTRGRRGSLEELVKSLKNDPYYIARGKKDFDIVESSNYSGNDYYYNTKELICSTVDLLLAKFQANKVKRDVNDNERNRRATLKKLALQLQIDPYFVSRGKKSDIPKNKSHIADFIDKILVMCNELK